MVFVSIVLALMVLCCSPAAMAVTSLELPGVTAAGLGGAAAALQADASLMNRNAAGLSSLSESQLLFEADLVEGQKAFSGALLQPNQNGISGGLYFTTFKQEARFWYQDIGYAVALGPVARHVDRFDSALCVNASFLLTHYRQDENDPPTCSSGMHGT